MGGVGREAVKEGRLERGGGIKLMRWFSASRNNKLSSKSIKETYMVWLERMHTRARSNPAAPGNESNKTAAVQTNGINSPAETCCLPIHLIPLGTRGDSTTQLRVAKPAGASLPRGSLHGASSRGRDVLPETGPGAGTSLGRADEKI